MTISNRRLRRGALLTVALLAYVFCAAPVASAAENRCAGGGQPRPDEGGIGGTGVESARPDDEGGIGGTGISTRADTGIIGTVTGFASICVGGTEIHYAANTPVQIDGQLVTPERLAIGQVVEVLARSDGAQLHARQIAVRHVVVGPVTRIDAQRNEIEVVGQTVRLSPLTRTAEGSQEYAAVATAFPLPTSVQVSGMRQGNSVVVASRVSRTAPNEPAQVTGPVTRVETGTVWIAGTAVRTASPLAISIGDEVRARGLWDGSAIIATTVEAMPRVPFDGRATRVDIEGFARPATAGQLQVGAFSMELPPAAAQELARLSLLDARIRIHASVRDRRVVVERIGLTDELPALPPPSQLQRDSAGWNGGRPNDARNGSGAPPPDDSRPGELADPPPRQGADTRPDGDSGLTAAPGPVGNDRPADPPPPDRPAKPQLPDRPTRPDRPSIPIPMRPEIPGRH